MLSKGNLYTSERPSKDFGVVGGFFLFVFLGFFFDEGVGIFGFPIFLEGVL